MLKEWQGKLNTALAAAKAISGKYVGKAESMTADEERQFDAFIDDAEAARKQVERFKRESSLDEFAGKSAGTLPLAGKENREGEGDGDGDGDADGGRATKDAPLYAGMDPRLERAMKATKTKTYMKSIESYIRTKGQFDFLTAQARKDLSEGVDSDGGFWVPEDFRTEIIKKLPGMSAVRGRARIVPTSRDMVSFPLEDYNTDDKYTSSMRITWVDENPATDSETDSPNNDPGQLHIYVRTAMAGKLISNNLLEDAAFDILGYVQELLTESFGLGENDTFLTGSGIGRPFGLFNSANPQFPTSVVSGHATQVTADGVIDLFYGLPKQYRNSAAFWMNSNTAKAIRKLKDAQNRYLWDSMSNGGVASEGDKDTLLGKEVVIDEFCPDIAANAYPIAFGDAKGYYIVDRVGMSIQVLREKYAERNQVKILGRKRVGGQVAEKFRFRTQKISA
jgi:HK97 family phage major capsid protein